MYLQAPNAVVSHASLCTAIKNMQFARPVIFKMPLDLYVATISLTIRQLLSKFRDAKVNPIVLRRQVSVCVMCNGRILYASSY